VEEAAQYGPICYFEASQEKAEGPIKAKGGVLGD